VAGGHGHPLVLKKTLYNLTFCFLTPTQRTSWRQNKISTPIPGIHPNISKLHTKHPTTKNNDSTIIPKRKTKTKKHLSLEQCCHFVVLPPHLAPSLAQFSSNTEEKQTI
jgi:hypothetical protein